MHYRARSYDPRTGRFMQSEPLLDRRAFAHFSYVSNNPLSRLDPTGLYEEDFHYYAVYYLGLAAGLDEGHAFTVAYASQYMDDWRSSVAPQDQTQLRGLERTKKQTMRFHFVADVKRAGVTPETRDVVTEGNDVVQQYVTDAIAAISAEYVGIEIHALADSFSHAGFVGYWDSKNMRTGSARPNVGHADSGYGGHEVDLPFRDVDKAVRAAKAVYARLVDFAQSKGRWNRRATFESIEPKLRKLFGTGEVAEKDYNHDKSLKTRVTAWQDFFRSEAESPVFGEGKIRWAKYDRSLWDQETEGSIFFKGRVADIMAQYKLP